jgi:hypothetical protein
MPSRPLPPGDDPLEERRPAASPTASEAGGVGGEFAVRSNSPLRRSLARAGGRDAVRTVRDLLILAIHLVVTFVKLLRPGGVCAVAAESLLLKHQLLILGCTVVSTTTEAGLWRSLLSKQANE